MVRLGRHPARLRGDPHRAALPDLLPPAAGVLHAPLDRRVSVPVPISVPVPFSAPARPRRALDRLLRLGRLRALGPPRRAARCVERFGGVLDEPVAVLGHARSRACAVGGAAGERVGRVQGARAVLTGPSPTGRVADADPARFAPRRVISSEWQAPRLRRAFTSSARGPI